MKQKVHPVSNQRFSNGAYVISVNMGYGHQRTAYPLKYLTPKGQIINANDYRSIPDKDRKIWEGTRWFYELVSRLKRVPLIGETIFLIYDEFQKILSFYPKRDLSKPNFQLKQIFSLIKKGWGKNLIKKLSREPLPLISTFFIPAFMAEAFNYPGKIYCVVCDTDISRTWAPLNPSQSKIKYFAPNFRVVERLKLYGVKSENIFLTGYPLPTENITTDPSAGRLEILKNDLLHRFLNLDPQGRYQYYYGALIKKYLGELPSKTDHPLTLMFAVGGAGAQKEIGVKVVKSLAKKIKEKEVKVILVAGVRKKVRDYFIQNIEKLGLKDNNVEIIFAENIEDYFQKFNQALRKTDILWTKPSELSFYAALGLPIIIAPSIGSQEDFNKSWLLKSGFGNFQKDPRHTDQWLFDWLSQGYLAEAAMQGFIEGEKLGAFNIQKIVIK